LSLFQSLFKETADHGVHKKHLKRVSRVCKHLDDAEKMLPKMNYPEIGTDKFNEDLAEVRRCMTNPCLTDKFLHRSDDQVSDVFRDFLEKADVCCVDWDKIDKLLDDVDSIVLRLKYKHKRPRPMHFLKNESGWYDKVGYSKSPSFPSGHTSIAYFLKGVLSNEFPDVEGDLTTLADMIGQSRIENGVHFPSDVEYGKLIGQILSDRYIDDDGRLNDIQFRTKDYRDFSKYLRDVAINMRSTIDKSDALNAYIDDLGEFLMRTNEIERYSLNHSDCNAAARDFMMGYPVEYITDDPHIASQLNCLMMSHKLSPVDNVSKIFKIHECFDPSVIERQEPGVMRNFSHFSPMGVKYSDPDKIHDDLKRVLDYGDRPFFKHILYEWVHPFCDGNGRSGRIILAADLDYNFDITNQLIDADYIKTLSNYMLDNDIENMLR